MPVLNISGTQAIVSFLMMVVIFGSLHLLAAAHPDAKLSKAWVSLGF